MRFEYEIGSSITWWARHKPIVAAVMFTLTGVLGDGWQTEVMAQTEATGQRLNYNIRAGELGPAISQFGRVSNLQLLYPASLARGHTTSGVSGNLTPREALVRLLAGTGLVYQFTGGNTVTIIETTPVDGAPVIADGSTVLQQLTVEGGSNNAASGAGFRGTPDWVYDQPSSVSVISRESLQTLPARNATELFDQTAGTYAADNPQNPGVNVNIRGLQDQNRVNMMVDGARQNFQRAGHYSSSYAYIDPSMIRSVEVNKSTDTGSGSAGALGGSVNFRTLEVGDLLDAGEDFGGEVTISTGTNAYRFNGSASVAGVISDSFKVLGSISFKSVGEYAVGQNGTVIDFQNNAVGDPVFTGLEATSGMLKAELELTPDLDFTMSWLGYQSDFVGGTEQYVNRDKVNNQTINAKFDWNPVDPLIDLHLALWGNLTIADQHRDARSTYDAFDVEYGMASVGIDLENTSQIDLSFGDLTLNYGVEAFNDASTTEAVGADPTDDPEDLWFSGPNPEGSRTVASGFSTATFERDWLTLTAGLRYDYYHMNGTSKIYAGQLPNMVDVTTCEEFGGPIFQSCTRADYEAARASFMALGHPFFSNPANWPDWPVGRPDDGLYVTNQVQQGWNQVYDNIEVQTSGGRALPAASISVEPIEGFQLFGKYSEGWRPPTVQEALIGGSHIGGIGNFYPNPSLQPEHATTWELGVNVSRDGILFDDDNLRFKGVLFDRSVMNYIALGAVNISSSLGAITSTGYVNLEGETRMKGVELEASYDAGFAYVGGSYTHMQSDYAKTYTLNGVTASTQQLLIYAPPEEKYTLDAGVRLFDQALTIGGRMNYVGPSRYLGGAASQSQAPGYTTYDVYGSYTVTENAKISFAIKNITDLAYVPVLGLPGYPAPGRTATLAMTGRF